MSQYFESLSLEQLSIKMTQLETDIVGLKTKIYASSKMLECIERRITEISPKEMSLKEIEQKLGHKVVVTDFRRLNNIDCSESSLYELKRNKE